ncbi:hypothetical protein E2C01_014856 [Portunus trituberculatus]|uniref:Uncharacterized protein n=1 Tax=Portunus trituberculatus TaxID=210409 RepID=A0A5B7DL34_PORTR|nr:hypothetical protein [Portunus trituberculatus]
MTRRGWGASRPSAQYTFPLLALPVPRPGLDMDKKEAKDTPFKRTERTYTHRDIHRGTPALKRLDDKLGRTIRITRVRAGRNIL